MEVKCKTNDTLELSQLVEFQGNLKERTDADFEKIAKSIKNDPTEKHTIFQQKIKKKDKFTL